MHDRLAELVAAMKGENYATTVSWIRSKVSFAILRSALLCLRGSKTVRSAISKISQAENLKNDATSNSANGFRLIQNRPQKDTKNVNPAISFIAENQHS